MTAMTGLPQQARSAMHISRRGSDSWRAMHIGRIAPHCAARYPLALPDAAGMHQLAKDRLGARFVHQLAKVQLGAGLEHRLAGARSG
jgi:hypothetical protein